MNRYKELRNRQQEEFNKFPIKFAFSQEQFERGMRELGLEPTDTDKVCKTIAGGFLRKSDAPAMHEILTRHHKEIEDAIAADKDGTGFVYDMFLYELQNHEYGYTWETEDTLESLGYTEEQVEADPKLKAGFEKAKKHIQNLED